MDTIDTTSAPSTDIVFTDEAALVVDVPDTSFGKEIAKTLVISAATTAGMIGGLIAAAHALEKFRSFKTKRASKDETPVVIEGEVVEEPQAEPVAQD
jgi:hypothetical protein